MREDCTGREMDETDAGMQELQTKSDGTGGVEGVSTAGECTAGKLRFSTVANR